MWDQITRHALEGLQWEEGYEISLILFPNICISFVSVSDSLV